jgi:hypothetical protein
MTSSSTFGSSPLSEEQVMALALDVAPYWAVMTRLRVTVWVSLGLLVELAMT